MVRNVARCIQREGTNRLEAGCIRGMQICMHAGVRTRPLSEDVAPMQKNNPIFPSRYSRAVHHSILVRSFTLSLSLSFSPSSPSFSVATTNSSPLLRGLIPSSSSVRLERVELRTPTRAHFPRTAHRSFSGSTRDDRLHSSARLHSAAHALYSVSTRRARTHGSTHGRTEEFRQVREKKSAVFSRLVQLFRKKIKMREIVHLQAGQCGNQIGAKVGRHDSSKEMSFYALYIKKKNLLEDVQIIYLKMYYFHKTYRNICISIETNRVNLELIWRKFKRSLRKQSFYFILLIYLYNVF